MNEPVLPTETPLIEATPDQLGHFIDSHLLQALQAADLLTGARFGAEDYLRDRIVALSDTYTEPGAVMDECRRRTRVRLSRLFAGSEARS